MFQEYEKNQVFFEQPLCYQYPFNMMYQDYVKLFLASQQSKFLNNYFYLRVKLYY